MTSKNIKHNRYCEGKVQSLEFTTLDGQRISIGVVQKGDKPHHFPAVEEPEVIKLIGGELTINGVLLTKEHAAILVHVGEEIVLDTPDFASYACWIGHPKRR